MTDGELPPEPPWEPPPRPMFAHPPWTVGLVLVIAGVMLILGILAHPVWLLLGAPFIATLAVWVWVRLVLWRRRRAARSGGDPETAAPTDRSGP